MGPRSQRVGQSGDNARGTGAGCDECHPRAPGDSCINICRVPSSLRVTDGDNTNVFVHAAVVDGLDVPSAEGESVGNGMSAESLRYQSAAMKRLHHLEYDPNGTPR